MIADRETQLLQQYDRGGEPSALFILGAPRTGSTALYQALAYAFALPFISNFTDRTTPDAPIVGILESYGRWSGESGRLESKYGKTSGEHAPSEGSAVLSRWCGGGHPSEITSPGVLATRLDHMAATLRAVNGATNKPLAIKNAWNCFRLASLAAEFPRAGFIWIRRDIGAAARSDLAARYARQGDAGTWNSATPRNVEDLRRRPYWEQVVENQYEFSRAIAEAAPKATGRMVEVWYEDFCGKPGKTLEALAGALGMLPPMVNVLPTEAIGISEGAGLPKGDRERIDAFLHLNPARWSALTRGSGGSN